MSNDDKNLIETQKAELDLLLDKENNIINRFFQLHLFDSESGMDGYTIILKINKEKLTNIWSPLNTMRMTKSHTKIQDIVFDWLKLTDDSEFIVENLIRCLINEEDELRKDIQENDYVIDELLELSEELFLAGGYYAQI